MPAPAVMKAFTVLLNLLDVAVIREVMSLLAVLFGSVPTSISTSESPPLSYLYFVSIVSRGVNQVSLIASMSVSLG